MFHRWLWCRLKKHNTTSWTWTWASTTIIGRLLLLQQIKPAMLITVEKHRRITKPSLVKDLLFKQGTFKRPSRSKATHSRTSGFAVKFLQGYCWTVATVFFFLQKHKDPQCRKGFPPSPFTVLSPQVTFLCNSSLETITLPWSPDAHQHTEQMRRQSWETGRLQSDTSQVWLCGYVSLSPLLSELCEVPLRSPRRTEGAGSFSWTKGGNWEQLGCIK